MKIVTIYTALGIPPGETKKKLLFNTVSRQLAEQGLRHFPGHTKVELKDSPLFLAEDENDIVEMEDTMLGHKLVHDMSDRELAVVEKYLKKKPEIHPGG